MRYKEEEFPSLPLSPEFHEIYMSRYEMVMDIGRYYSIFYSIEDDETKQNEENRVKMKTAQKYLKKAKKLALKLDLFGSPHFIPSSRNEVLPIKEKAILKKADYSLKNLEKHLKLVETSHKRIPIDGLLLKRLLIPTFSREPFSTISGISEVPPLIDSLHAYGGSKDHILSIQSIPSFRDLDKRGLKRMKSINKNEIFCYFDVWKQLFAVCLSSPKDGIEKLREISSRLGVQSMKNICYYVHVKCGKRGGPDGGGVLKGVVDLSAIGSGEKERKREKMKGGRLIGRKVMEALIFENDILAKG